MMRDTVEPDGAWVFDTTVAASFDDMLERSIPQYSVMRDAVTGIGCRFMDKVQGHGTIIDLGCSRGAALAPFVDRYGQSARVHGIEVSQPMLDEARTLFAEPIKSGIVTLEGIDLRTDWPTIDTTVHPNYLTLCILTLQFIPMEHRQRLLASLLQTMGSGGAFLLVDKMLGATVSTYTVFQGPHSQLQRPHG